MQACSVRVVLSIYRCIWCRANPPDESKPFLRVTTQQWAQLGSGSLIESSPFKLLNHFPLPPEAWWDDFYTPMERVIEEFLGKYADDPEALEILKHLALEPVAHRKNSDYYNYEFYYAKIRTSK